MTSYGVLLIGLMYLCVRFGSPMAPVLSALVTSAYFTSQYFAASASTTYVLAHLTYASWIYFLLTVAGFSPTGREAEHYRQLAALAGLTLAATVGAVATTLLALPEYYVWLSDLVICILGLVVAEQVGRNMRPGYRWKLQFMYIGVGTIFAYGLFIHADALLVSNLDSDYLAMQPIIISLVTPFIFVSMLRNRGSEMRMSISRRFVFRTGILLIAGAYLLALGMAGYVAQLLEADWSNMVTVAIATVGLIGFFIVSGSTVVRNYLRVALARNLFEYKHDYLDEWSRATKALTHPDQSESIGSRIIRTLADTVYATEGGLWVVSNAQVLVPLEQLHGKYMSPIHPELSRALITFFETKEWVIDITEYEAGANTYRDLDLQGIHDAMSEPRLIVPLMLGGDVYGVVMITSPQVPLKLVWEDFNLLRVVARQSAGFLALQRAEHALQENRQLNAFNQLAAFVVHDIKTVASQLSLLMENAERHKSNPAFIDDMLKTTENAVSRMNNLLAQLEEHRAKAFSRINLEQILADCASRFAEAKPTPEFLNQTVSQAWVEADGEQLGGTVGHIVQNAIDATPETGSVAVSLDIDGPWATIDITDTGPGMTADFIQHRLFEPFESTKGLTGMGIGVYQAREYIRSIGGDIAVASQPNNGTTFTIRIPVSTHE